MSDKYYDKKHNRLIYISQEANSDFWDKRWTKQSEIKPYKQIKAHPWDYVVKTSQKYLPPKAKILEGGCGKGNQVVKLDKAGFDIIGLDYAKETIEQISKVYPKLKFRLGDVRSLPFENNTFDAYWSFGVIEHFYTGYNSIISEMQRVLKPEGYLFLTFPHMSKLRRYKAKRNKYPLWEAGDDLLNNFYQFALHEPEVIKVFENAGFKFIKKQHLNGLKGLKDESSHLNKFLQKLYDSSNIFARVIAKLISLFVSQFASHSILLVLKKRHE